MNFQQPYPFPTPPHLMDSQNMGMKSLNQTLYIGDIDDQLNEGMLYQFFIKFGPIYSVRIMRDVYNQKKSRGFGYVTYYNAKDAEAARINANHEVILKRPIRVTWKKNFRELDREANVYIRNIDPSLNIRELDSYFSKFGAIFSSKITLDDNGASLGYGYVQFEKKEQAEECLKQGEIQTIKENYNCKVERFQSSKTREKRDLRNNLYIKNFPKDITEEALKTLFSKFGEIVSICLKEDKKMEKKFCFCCFKTNEEATKCLTELQEKNPFNTNEKLYITYAEKKDIRMKKLRESFANILNETNLFTKNLLKHVTVDNLIQIFKQFGEVTSVAIKEIKSVDPKFPSETNFGFICFAKKEDAKQALVSALKDQTLQELYKDRNIYLTYHYRKEQYSVYKEMKKRTMAKYFSARQFQNFQNPMFLPFPMPVPPPMFAGNQFSNFPPQYMGNMMGNPPQYPPHYQPNRYHSPDNNFHRGGGQRRGGPPSRKNYNSESNTGRYNDNNRYNDKRNFKQQKVYQKHEGTNPVSQHQAPAEETQPKSFEPFTIQLLKEKINDFLVLPQEKQRTILGELLFPLVQKHVSQESLAPKVTGMLIDFSVFEVGDIVEFLDNQEILHERVSEAEGLIQTTSG